MEAMNKEQYRVYVDDNFHFMDEDERHEVGTFESLEEAVSKCQNIVNRFFIEHDNTESKPEDLYNAYVSFGEDPFIIGPTHIRFVSWNYAKALSSMLVGTSAAAYPAVAEIFGRGYRAAYLDLNKAEECK